MKTRILMLSALLSLPAGWNGCHNQKIAPSLSIYDVLPTEQAIAVNLSPGLSLQGIHKDDQRAICLALGRTPKVAYEIKNLAFFPAQDIPMAARVQVPGFVIFMCRGSDDQWHVYRIGQYRY